jgi:DNA-directed RNA polymerase specialized sigma24 family protein
MDVDLERTRGFFLRARAGDAEALRALFEQHGLEFARLAQGRLPPALREVVDPTDVAKGALLHAVEEFDAFEDRGPGSLRRWLQAILEDEVRGVQRLLGLSKHDLEMAELRMHMDALLDTLRPDHREVIRLVDLERKSVAEAAVLLGRSESEAKKLLARARRCFHERLNTLPPDAP